MITFRAGRIAAIALLVILVAGCSREQQDWRSAEAADTSEAYGRFLEQHPDSELAPQARTRVAQLAEEHDWQRAQGVGTIEAYRQFLAQHPSGKRSEEARVRIEGFALGSAPRLGATSAVALRGASGVNALAMATTAAPPPIAHGTSSGAAIRLAQVQPGEAAQPATRTQASITQRPGSASGTASGGYGVQLGAYSSAASADREWQRLQGRFSAQLSGLSPRIVTASSQNGQLYRLQAGAAGESQARAICASLQEQSQPCVPVLPR